MRDEWGKYTVADLAILICRRGGLTIRLAPDGKPVLENPFRSVSDALYAAKKETPHDDWIIERGKL